MIKILIIDDCYDKTQKIIQAIKEKFPFILPEQHIDVVQDATSGRKKLAEQNYDLLILDINLPPAMGEEPSKSGGIDLLEKIHTKQILKYPHHIIGITGYQDIYIDSKKELEKYLWTLIHYDNTNNGWAEKIIHQIDYLINSKQSFYGECFKKYDIAVVTALEEPELQAVLDLPFNWKEVNVPNDTTTIYHEGTVGVGDKQYSIVAASAPKMGMVPSSILTTKMCTHFHPTYLFMVGIAAGIEGKNNYGDILVSEFSWDWGSGKISADFSPDHTQIPLDVEIIKKIKQLSSDQGVIDNIKNGYKGNKPETTLKIHLGPIASGASVLENKEIVESVKKYQRKLIGIEMEIYGVLSAVKYSSKPSPIPICLKSVCDFGDTSKSDDWQHYAAFTSASAMYLLIEKLDF
jgi:nucleoside phosphorylase/CheY-like chemotaxis protein